MPAEPKRKCEVHKIRHRTVVDEESKWLLFRAENKNGKVVGKVTSNVTEDADNNQFLFINTLEVTADCRRRGVGAKLVEDVKATAKKEGLNYIYLNPSPLENGEKLSTKEVKQFYKEVGFKPSDSPDWIEKLDDSTGIDLICRFNRQGLKMPLEK